MNQESLISVVAPVYNVEKYLRKFLNSVLGQTYSHFELLLVNDGSTDGSGDVCEEYALRDMRIRTFHQVNQGVSSARNMGIRNAVGAYLLFLDPDDWIESNMLETLYGLLFQYKAGCSVCGFQKEDESGWILLKVEESVTYVENGEQTLLTLFNQDKFYKYQGWIWNKLFVKEIIDKNKIQFRTDIYYSEDRLFVFDYLKYCSFPVVFSTLPMYHYLVRSDGAMGTAQTGKFKEKNASFIGAFQEMFQYACANYSITVQRAIASNYALDVVNLYLKFKSDLEGTDMQRRLKAIVRELLPFLSSYESIFYRSFLMHPSVYQMLVRFRYQLHRCKCWLKQRLR